MEGAKKSVSGWQKSFYDLRNGIRLKFSQVRNHAYKTGGGEPLDVELDPLEERLLGVLPPEQVDGMNCMEGGYDTNTVPNLMESRPTIARTESPVIPTDDTDPLSISETAEHPTSLDFDNYILSHHISISQLPGPSTVMVTAETPAPIRLSSPAPRPELPPVSPSSPDAPPATHSSHSDIKNPNQPQLSEALPPSTAPRRHHPRIRSARNLYRTSLSKNSQESLQLQKETLKELRKSNTLNQETNTFRQQSNSIKQNIIRLIKKESEENERRHKQLTTLIKQIIGK